MEPLTFNSLPGDVLGDIRVIQDGPKTVTVDDSTGIFGLESFINPDKLGTSTTTDIPAAPQPIELQPLDNLMGVPAPDLAPIPLEPLPIGNTFQIAREPDVKPIHFENVPGVSAPPSVSSQSTPLSHEAEQIEKGELLSKIGKLEKRGVYCGRKLYMASPLADIRSEYSRMLDDYKRARFVQNWRKRIVQGASMAEFTTKRFSRLGVDLTGFSEKVDYDINNDEYDDDLDDFYDEMKEIDKLPAWMRLAGGLGMSAFMVHMSNTFTRTSTPGIDKIEQNNPALAYEIASNMARNAGSEFFGATGTASAAPRPAVAAAAATGVRGAAPARREMRAPPDIDEILRAHEAEQAAAPRTVSMPEPSLHKGRVQLRPVSVPMPETLGPSAMPEAPRGVRVTAPPVSDSNGVGLSGMPLGPIDLDEGSVHSGASSRRGRPRRPIPTGNSVNIDV